MGSKRMNSQNLQVPENFGFQLDAGFLLLICCLIQALNWNSLPHPLHLNVMDDISFLFGQGPNPVSSSGLGEVSVKTPFAAFCFQISV